MNSGATRMSIFRKELERKDKKEKDNVTFVVDGSDGHVSRIFRVLGEKDGNEDEMTGCYPAYFIFTPERELVQFCVLKNADKTQEESFTYPITDRVVSEIDASLARLQTAYKMLKRLRDEGLPNFE